MASSGHTKIKRHFVHVISTVSLLYSVQEVRQNDVWFIDDSDQVILPPLSLYGTLMTVIPPLSCPKTSQTSGLRQLDLGVAGEKMSGMP